MVNLAHGLKVHGNLLWDWIVMGGSSHLLTMMEFRYNVKKRKVIQNEIMVFHKHLQPTT